MNHPTDRNLEAPTGNLADSGWQLQGIWHGFLGTPISPHHFITAEHVGIGGSFSYDGQQYSITATFIDPETDLAIFQVDGTFDSFAPLYTESDEAGQDIVFFGRGTDRGDPVTDGTTLKGWEWGTDDRDRSWGQNTVEGISNIIVNGKEFQALGFTFDAGAGPNEAHLTGGDSDGGAFILDDGVWKLAGIHAGAESLYSLSDVEDSVNNPGFRAAIFDQSGLFVRNDTNTAWEAAEDRPGASFTTRISARIDWINSVIIPEPSTGLIMLTGGWLLATRRRTARHHG